MNDGELVKIVQEILDQNRKECYLMDSSRININVDLINKYVNHKVQFTIISYILTSLLSNKEYKPAEGVIQTIIDKSIINNLNNLNKLVTNYHQLLNGLQIIIQNHRQHNSHSDLLTQLSQKLFNNDVFVNKAVFYERMEKNEPCQWFGVINTLIGSDIIDY